MKLGYYYFFLRLSVFLNSASHFFATYAYSLLDAFHLNNQQAFSLLNFRGPLTSALICRGVETFAIARYFEEQTRASVQLLGVVPVDCSPSRTGLNPVSGVVSILRLAILLSGLKLKRPWSIS